MSVQPLVSVVIPSYNQASFLAENLASILTQSYRNLEVIFIDDGSTDNTKEIITKINDERLKYVYQTNSERAVARSHGIKLATGKYVCLVDSDDIWYKNKVEQQVKVMENDPELVLCYASVDRIDEHSKKIKTAKRQQQGSSGYVYFDLLKRNFIPSVTPMIRKDILDEVGDQNTKFIPYEDWDFWLKIARLGKFKHLKKALGAYRLHSAQSVQNVKAYKIAEVTMAVLKENTRIDPFSLSNEHYLYLADRRFGTDFTQKKSAEFAAADPDKKQKNLQKYLKMEEKALKVSERREKLLAELDRIKVRLYKREVNGAFSLAHMRLSYWYIIANENSKARAELFKVLQYNKLNASDYRWYGLMVVSYLRPVFGKVIVDLLGSYH